VGYTFFTLVVLECLEGGHSSARTYGFVAKQMGMRVSSKIIVIVHLII
jgi:hypothetical protein